MGISEKIKPCPIIVNIKTIKETKGKSGIALAVLRAFENGRIKGKINKIKTSISPTKKSDIEPSQIQFKELI
ncbi:hypothetical protein E4N76_08845 [Treponema putidum]|uniref:Uncharacterized protein n=1 Tax=Treponema putidum TaxID=221027 RepID=A0AAE9SKI1_9SPIR|nr:hypothetical protein E4N76_08845 [Treponema putidum]UTY32515.1 hypothetical protein E4N75_08170 [Treponema putidum]UTY34921.1 hypothetical protein E4N74_07800 [Treponema putidum]